MNNWTAATTWRGLKYSMSFNINEVTETKTMVTADQGLTKDVRQKGWE